MSKQPVNNEFIQLRIRARERRDNAIAKVRQEYEETLLAIAQLEQQLLGRAIPDQASLSAAVESVIPIGEEFTITDIMRKLEANDPGRVWARPSVSRHITKLRELKLIRRTKRRSVNRPAAYIRDDQDEDNRTLQQIVEQVCTKPMRTAEVVHAALEAGWETTMNRQHFRAAVKACLRRAGMKERDGKWGH